MTSAEARRIVWERLATTAVNDADTGEWVEGYSDNEADQVKIIDACKDVATMIRRRFTGKAKR